MSRAGARTSNFLVGFINQLNPAMICTWKWRMKIRESPLVKGSRIATTSVNVHTISEFIRNKAILKDTHSHSQEQHMVNIVSLRKRQTICILNAKLRNNIAFAWNPFAKEIDRRCSSKRSHYFAMQHTYAIEKECARVYGNFTNYATKRRSFNSAQSYSHSIFATMRMSILFKYLAKLSLPRLYTVAKLKISATKFQVNVHTSEYGVWNMRI